MGEASSLDSCKRGLVSRLNTVAPALLRPVQRALRQAIGHFETATHSTGTVTFEPGARTAWHTHPLGQMLIVTSGVGYVQQEGGPRLVPAVSWLPSVLPEPAGAILGTGG